MESTGLSKSALYYRSGNKREFEDKRKESLTGFEYRKWLKCSYYCYRRRVTRKKLLDYGLD
jgi:hypothetical protein